MRKKQKNVCTDLNCFEHFLILAAAGCISISAFAFWIHVFIGITSFAIKLKVFAMASGIKKYKSIIKKKEKKHDKKILLATSKLNSTELVISKASINWNISHDKFVSMNNVLKEYDDMKEEIRNLKA